VSLMVLLFIFDDLARRESKKSGMAALQLDPKLVSSARTHYASSIEWLRDLFKDDAELEGSSDAASHHVYNENFQAHLNRLHWELKDEYSHLYPYLESKPLVEWKVNRHKERMEGHRKGLRDSLELAITEAYKRVSKFCQVSTVLPVSSLCKTKKLTTTSRP
jgi:hypothetical protein